MGFRCQALSLSLTVLLTGAHDAVAADLPPPPPSAAPVARAPLQLRLDAGTVQPLSQPPRRQVSGSSADRRGPRFQQNPPSLSEQALQSLLDDADRAAHAPAGATTATFTFKRRGNAGRDIAQGYNNMLDSLSRKVWDDPKGKRLKFDVAGKPGVAVEIPLR